MDTNSTTQHSKDVSNDNKVGYDDSHDKQDTVHTEKSCEPVPSYKYGWFGFTPSWLQRFHTAGWLLLFLSLGNSFQSGVVSGLLGVVLSTIETRFTLSSSQSSWIASAYDVGTIPVLLAFCLIGSK